VARHREATVVDQGVMRVQRSNPLVMSVGPRRSHHRKWCKSTARRPSPWPPDRESGQPSRCRRRKGQVDLASGRLCLYHWCEPQSPHPLGQSRRSADGRRLRRPVRHLRPCPPAQHSRRGGGVGRSGSRRRFDRRSKRRFSAARPTTHPSPGYTCSLQLQHGAHDVSRGEIGECLVDLLDRTDLGHHGGEVEQSVLDE
jgi:hypothetical protein